MTSFPCPTCGADAVACGCDGLSIQDQSRIIAALQYDFTSLDHAMDVVCETVDSNSLLHTAAMQFIILNAPEGVREIISKAFEKVFKNKWLDVEEVYRKAGWKVEYDKPGYCEDYEAYFVFEKR